MIPFSHVSPFPLNYSFFAFPKLFLLCPFLGEILECEVKWALESITTNKASGGDGIPVELFQILKDDAVKAQGSNPGFLHCRQTLYHLSHQGSPYVASR